MSRDALVIGINKYANYNLNNLNNQANHAEAIAKLLETKGGFKVRRLPCIEVGSKLCINDNRGVGIRKLKSAIYQLFNPESDQLPDTALLFFAGHGLKGGFIAASNTNPNEVDTAISLRWLADLLQDSKVRQQIVFIDACFSGKFVEYVKKLSSTHDRCVITSARAHEEALAKGLLTQALLESLDYTKQPKDTPWVTNYNLEQLLKDKNKTNKGWQRFQIFNTGQPIVLTNKAVENKDYTDVCPYKGLNYFDNKFEDALYFKGRSKLTEELLEKIQETNFLAVLGASGNGKSSVVRAGLLYQLQQTQIWKILPVITPTAEPLKALGNLIKKPAEQLSDFINQTETERIVLVIDQFEEVFTLCKNDNKREQFFKILLEATELKGNKFCLVLVMRADFLEKCSHFVDLAKKIQTHQIIVTPMTPEELEEAIVEPSKLVGLQIESKLVSEMLVDVKSLGNLPLLEYTLTELWQKCAFHRLLTFSAYEKLGKIAGTLEKAANGIYNKFSEEEKKITKQIFIELIQLGEGSPDTSRQRFKKDLLNSLPFNSSQVKQVIQQLVAAYLLVIDRSTEQQGVVVNIAHDALVQHWGRLRSWLDDNRNVIKIQRDIEADAKKWEDNNKSKDALLQGLNLNIAKDYMKEHNETVPLSPLAQDCFKRSINRQRKYKIISIGTGVGMILISVVFSIYFYQLRIEADKQRKLAEAETTRANQEKEIAEKQAKLALAGKLSTKAILAAELPSLVNGSPDQALLLAIQAWNLHNDSNKQGILRHVLQKTNSQIQRFIKINKEKASVAFSPDGKSLISGCFISGCSDKTIILLDVTTGLPIGQPWHGHKDGVTSIAFSSNGQQVITGSWDQTVILWNVKTGKQIGKTIHLHEHMVSSVSFSSDGKHVISGSYDKTLILWKVTKNGLMPVGKPWKRHTNKVTSVAFSPNGKYVISGSWDKTLILWNVDTGKPVRRPWYKHKGGVTSVAFSPNSKYVISGSKDKTLILWKVATGMPIGKPWQGHKEFVWNVAISANGKYVISGSWDKTLIQWKVPSGERMGEPWQGHQDKIYDIDFFNSKQIISSGYDDTIILWDFEKNPLFKIYQEHTNAVLDISVDNNSKKAISASLDNSLILWDIETGKMIGKPWKEHNHYVLDTAFSPDGKKVLSASADKTLILWDVETGEPIGKPWKGHKNWVWSVDFHPNGKYAISGSKDNTLILWDTQTGKPIGKPWKGHEKDVRSVKFSHDGKMVISGSYDETLILWDAQTGKPIGKPWKGHKHKLINEKATIRSVAFSPDDKWVISASADNTLILWNVKKGKMKGSPWKGHSKVIRSVDFSPDGKRIISGSLDNSLILWDLSGKVIGQPWQEEKLTRVSSVVWSPNGKYILSGSEDGTIIFWKADINDWVKIACRKVNRNFTKAEWKQFVGTRDYEKTCPEFPEGK
jgi:WD40 repeat protein